MFNVIFERVREDRYIVDENSVILSIFFQRPIYKALYIQKRVYIFYKDYIRMFYPSLANKGETISIIWMNEQLEKEVGYIDYNNILLSIDKVDDLLL